MQTSFTLSNILLGLIAYYLFLLSGFSIAKWISLRIGSKSCLFILSLGVASVVSYSIFWLAFLETGVAQTIACGFILLFGSQGLVELFREPRWKELCLDIFFHALTVVFYLSLLGRFASAYSTLEYVNLALADWPFPPDNRLPLLFAENLSNGEYLKTLSEDWRGSDRPPLATAIYFSVSSVLLSDRPSATFYQFFCTALNASWIFCVPLLSRFFGLSRQRCGIITLLVVLSAPFYINTVFVWPKLLCVPFSFLLFFVIRESNASRLSSVVVGIAAGLSLLVHQTIVFSLIAAALMYWRYLLKQSKVSFVILGLLITLFPWVAYQKFVDPPGNRLAKWHLAGATELDDRALLRSLLDSYSEIGFEGAVKRKLGNLRDSFWPRHGYFEWLGPLADLRLFSYASVFLSLGPLLLALLLFYFERRRGRLVNLPNNFSATIVFLGISSAFWIIAQFGDPGSTAMAPHYSYSNLLLYTVMIIALLPERFDHLMLLLASIYFLLVWGVFNPGSFSEPMRYNFAACATVLLSLALLFLLSQKGKCFRCGPIWRRSSDTV